MSLSTAQYLKDNSDDPLQFNLETGWQEVSRGLRLVVRGYTVLIAGAGLGFGLLWLALDGGPFRGQLDAAFQHGESLLIWSVFLLGLTPLLSYGLVLAGQWRCLMYAPQCQHAKELMYVCLYCVLVGAALNAVGACLDGAKTYAALQGGAADLDKLDWGSTGNILQMCSAAVGLFGSLVFSQFLRNVASCFNDRARIRSVDLNLGFVGLLVGGSVGTLFCVAKVSFRAEFLPWLFTGWLACFAWHLYLVWRVCGCVESNLRRLVRAQVVDPEEGRGAMSMHSLSGLRRLASRTPS